MLPYYDTDTYSPKMPDISIKQLFNSIVRIEDFSGYATGFFMKINIKDKELYSLITNCHVIPQSNVSFKDIIYIYYGPKENEIKKQIKLDSDERFIKCFDKPYDITIVEIKSYDYIPEDKFLLPDLDYKYGYNHYFYKKFYLAGYPKAENCHYKERHISSGLIYNIYNNNIEFEHSIDREVGASGSPICLLDNGKVVGVHKSNYTRKGFRFSYNVATFIGTIIDELSDYYFLLPEKKNNYEFNNRASRKYGLTRSKTENNFNLNSMFSMASSLMNFNFDNFEIPKIEDTITDPFEEFNSYANKKTSKIMDTSFSMFETKDPFDDDFFRFEQKKTINTKKNFTTKKKTNYQRSKTPVNSINSYNNINTTLTNNYNYINNNNNLQSYKFTSRNDLFGRVQNKSYEPKLKNKKKNRKKKNNKNMTNITTYKSNINNLNWMNYETPKKNIGILNYSNINYSKETIRTKNAKSRNYYSHISKSYDNYQSNYSRSNNNFQINISTIKNNIEYDMFSSNYNWN